MCFFTKHKPISIQNRKNTKYDNMSLKYKEANKCHQIKKKQQMSRKLETTPKHQS